MAASITVLLRLLQVIFLFLPQGKSERDGLGDCNNLSNTSFTYNAQLGQSIPLFCQKNCTEGKYRWYHAFTHHDQLTKIQEAERLDLAITEPPTQSIVGYFCCACSGEYVQGTSCCYGVAYSPQVVKFEISQDGKPVTVLHNGDSFTLECEVYGYPDVNLSITGPEAFQESNYQPGLERRWYSMKKTINILTATEDLNGTYQCQGLIYLTQGGETAMEASDDVLKQPLVVYKRPTADLKQESRAEDTVTFGCDVECSVDYNVSWLHNEKPIAITEGGKYQQYFSDSKHKLIVKITSPNDTGVYTCVVNTVYEANETSSRLGFSAASSELNAPDGRVGALLPGSASNSINLPAFIVSALVVVVFVILAVVIIYRRAQQLQRQRGRGTREHRDEGRQPLTEMIVSGDVVERDGVQTEETSFYSGNLNLEKKGLGIGYVPHRRKH